MATAITDAIIPQRESTKEEQQVRYMDTAEAYDRWAEVRKTLLLNFSIASC